MAKIDLTKQSSTPRPLRVRGRIPFQAYIMLGFGAIDLLERSPIGVVFVLMGCYLLYRNRTVSVAAPVLGSVGGRRADEVMVSAATALPDWWTIEQYRARAVPLGDSDQPAFPLVDLQGQVTGAIARDDIDQVASAGTADVRLRDLVRGRRRRPMLLVTGDSCLNTLAGAVIQHDAIAVVVTADQHPLGVITRSEITRSEIAHAKKPAA